MLLPRRVSGTIQEREAGSRWVNTRLFLGSSLVADAKEGRGGVEEEEGERRLSPVVRRRREKTLKVSGHRGGGVSASWPVSGERRMRRGGKKSELKGRGRGRSEASLGEMRDGDARRGGRQ